MDRRAWQIVHGVAKSQTRLSDLTATYTPTVQKVKETGHGSQKNVSFQCRSRVSEKTNKKEESKRMGAAKGEKERTR